MSGLSVKSEIPLTSIEIGESGEEREHDIECPSVWLEPLDSGGEKISAAHFQEFIGYLTGLAKSGVIQSFDPVFLEAHGGDLNGFVLIKGEPSKLDSLMSSRDWITHVTRALLHLEGAGAVRGVSGDGIAQRMALWTQHIPQ